MLKIILRILTILYCIVLYSGCKKDKVDPIITWENPLDIPYGTTLSYSQLNARSDVPGTFTYDPPIGAILDIGSNQDLKVDFSPLDINHYNKVSKTVKINVLDINIIVFNPNVTYGSMMDQDGNIYKTITIGTQTWMAENLRTTKFQNGDPIEFITDSTKWGSLNNGAYCWYNNNISNKLVYGALYNWYAVSDSRNIAPKGWHVSSDAEWTTLIGYLGFFAGKKMKETGMAHWWNSPIPINVTNESGFTALPGGIRAYSYGNFDQQGEYCYFWSKDQYDELNSWACYLSYDSDDLSSNYFNKRLGMSIRLIKD